MTGRRTAEEVAFWPCQGKEELVQSCFTGRNKFVKALTGNQLRELKGAETRGAE
jgi:hypothetical protein